MRIAFFLLFFSLGITFANTYAQNASLSLKMNGATIAQILESIENQTEFRFYYNSTLVNTNMQVSIDVENADVFTTLDKLFADSNVSYRVIDKDIILTTKQTEEAPVVQNRQQSTIRGTVTDMNGSPLIGVSVAVKGSGIGSVTDIDGNYSLPDVPEDAILVFSYIGFISESIPVMGKTKIDVRLKENNVELDEIVIVSFGTQKKRNMTGAVSSLKADDTRDRPVAQFVQGMQGKVSGVQIYENSGRPGEGVSFRIRGAGSLNSGNTPLFVVDGLPIAGEISNISPDEIESYSILKDASATALYGSRAANGVVLITTKRAKEGRTTVDFSTNVGIQTVPKERLPNLMNGTEYAQFKKNYYEDMIKYTGWTNPEGKAEVPDEYKNPEQYGKGTDWFDKITRTAPIQNYSVTVSSGTDKLRTTFIAAYTTQDGILKNTGYERFNARMNAEYHLSNFIRFGVNLAPSYRVHNNHETDGGWDIIASALYAPPILAFQNEDGSYPELLQAYGSLPQPHPYLMLTRRVNTYKGTRILGSAFVEVDILNGLSWKSSVSIDSETNNHRTYKPKEAAGGINNIVSVSSGIYQTGFASTWLTEHTLNYSNQFGQHNLELLGGFTAQKYRWEGSGIYGEEYSNDYPWITQAQTTKISGSNNPTSWAVASFLARVNYNYKEKYLFQAAIREDGCSRFGSDNRWGLFPSVSAGWIISEESFLEPLAPTLNYLKLRASYGLTGNNNIGDYSYYASISNSNYVLNNQIQGGTYLSSLENRKLGWEITKQFDLGLDFGFFGDRIYFQSDYWVKRTSDMLYNLTLPYSSGYGSIWSNTGEIKFWGFDFDLESRNLTGPLKWSTNFNISFSRNKVLSLGPNTDHLGGDSDYGGDWNRVEVGKPLGFLYGYVYDGVFMNEEELKKGPVYADSDVNRASIVGSPRMKDVSGPNGEPDGIITKDDRTMIGDPNPDFIFGITNSFEYKNFDFSFLITGSVGADLVMRTMEFSYNLDGAFNMDKALLNCWRSEENPGDGIIPRAAGPSGATWLARDRNSLMIYDGTYATLKT